MVTCVQKILVLHRFEKKPQAITSPKKIDHCSSLPTENDDVIYEEPLKQKSIRKLEFKVYNMPLGDRWWPRRKIHTYRAHGPQHAATQAKMQMINTLITDSKVAEKQKLDRELCLYLQLQIRVCVCHERWRPAGLNNTDSPS